MRVPAWIVAGHDDQVIAGPYRDHAAAIKLAHFYRLQLPGIYVQRVEVETDPEELER